MSVNTMNDQQRRQYQQQQQQQQQQGNRDLEILRRNYRTALSELTFNSKPIITNLTIMAQENQGAATVIVKEIENQLRINAVGQKLPVLYLIDSICKNVGGIYITIFGRNMVNVFLDAYTLSEPSVRERFERLLQTWKNGMPGGRPVFPRHVIEPIEKSIIYIREKQAKQSNNIHVNPNFVNKDKHLQANSRDPRYKTTIPSVTTTTQQTKQETLSPSSTASILAQIQSILPQQPQPMHTYQTTANTLNKPTAPQVQITQSPASNSVKQLIGQIQAILPTLSPAQANPIEQYLSQIASTTATTSANIVTATPTITSSIINSTSSPLLNKSPVINTASVLSSTPYAASPTPVPAVAKVDTADLLKSLTSMGYLDPAPSKPLSLESLGPFVLDSKDLQIPRPGAIELLYSAEPLQCKQCGFRYPKTEKGQQKMDAHLDSHFRQNRKMKERVKRGLSRSWFVTVEEWIHGEGGESMSQQVPTFLHDGMGHAVKPNEGANSTEDVINPDDHTVIKQTDERITCPICGETFVDFWNDDEEEWMYKNAVMESNKIYHATCHADAVKGGTLADNLNNISLKRKLEDENQPETKQQRTE
ncbi:hypothetical protein G6F57_004437 [Rhizopus arrhizus]|uniref:CID domain-containing protein n=1 Tax=Rhizopus oryzae TaxID=64495 RepID=A0A9P6XB29_RHIOR|nr:hypothetical protein G6F23_000168 [Rhizopus arrhizus]KAG1407375.1 hypothetical protein G6F58_009676 [Rhizopus delemar]KAG0950335.1 hypothetical protein G6F30_001739 [Rhizopus arrhizus]KAG0988358.1 hypothetical protein G6F29_001799 [Rhizopus arrhizus]KAG0997068.1 hypothetical protein G6F28_003246 [Rhizopus arrhizus]